MTLYSPDSYQLNITIDGEAANNKVAWVSTNPKVVSVDANGLVTINNASDKTETAIVSATANADSSKKASCEFVVIPNNQIHMLMAGPGEDASSSEVFSWHSINEGGVLELSSANSDKFEKIITPECAKTTVKWGDETTYFRYYAQVDGLEKNSNYKYRVKNADGSYSEVGSFRTAGADNFSFLWFSDLHAQNDKDIKNFETLVKASGKDPSFCLYTGDMVNIGKLYRNWHNWSTTGYLGKFTFAMTPGNHEYYPYGVKSVESNLPFVDSVAIPRNNGSIQPSFYYFIYKNILFVCMDSMANNTKGDMASKYSGSESLDVEKQWLEDVVAKNKGKYEFLIVAQHYAFLDGGSNGEAGNYDYWYPVFDKLGVDLAVSSDSHIYSRSKVLYNNQEAVKGTIYLTSPVVDSIFAGPITNDTSKLGDRGAFFGGIKDHGGVCFDVKPGQITWYCYGDDGSIYDTYTITK